MKFRRLLLPMLLSGAIGLPYLTSKTTGLVNGIKSLSTSAETARANIDSTEPAVPQGDLQSERFKRITDVPLEGVPIYSLSEVLRMDVTTAWVYSRWSRKSTALADLDLYGIRVPLMTGTNVDDLAGSMTYYFNPAGRVQRISFRGRTGDARKLVSLLVSQYGFRQQSAEIAGEQLYQVRWNSKPISELRIRPAPVIWATAPHASFLVELELERPGSGRFIERRPPPGALVPPAAAT
jgi:hypothetical protein